MRLRVCDVIELNGGRLCKKLIGSFQLFTSHRAAGARQQHQHANNALGITAHLDALDGVLHLREAADVVHMRRRLFRGADSLHPRGAVKAMESEFDCGIAGVAQEIPAAFDHIGI
jgi:hypothetical protein